MEIFSGEAAVYKVTNSNINYLLFIYLLVTKLNFTVNWVFDADDIDASSGLPVWGDTNIHSKPEQFLRIKILNQIEIML